MSELEPYDRYAEECRQQALEAKDDKTKTGYLALARYWEQLSVKFKRDSRGRSELSQ